VRPQRVTHPAVAPRTLGIVADSIPPTPSQPASVRLAELLGLPTPGPWTGVQEREYQRWLADGDQALAEVLARRAPRAA
jgi:hypothetical protein